MAASDDVSSSNLEDTAMKLPPVPSETDHR